MSTFERTFIIRSSLKHLLLFEPLILIITGYFFWFPSWFPAPPPPNQLDRADWFWLLGLLGLLYAVRWIVRGYVWTMTPLHPWMLAFLALCLISVEFAPYPSRGLMMLARPVYGMALVNYMIELGRYQRMNLVIWTMVIFGCAVGFIALTTTHWTEKSASLYNIIEIVPRLATSGGMFKGGFNPNEIAGALSWLTPLLFGLILLKRVRWLSAVGFGLLLLAVMFGQSRAAIAGVIVGLYVLVPLIQSRKWRLRALVGVTLLLLLEVAIFLNWLPDAKSFPSTVAARDERTFTQRLYIWEGSLDIVAKYPLTGVGMNRFRSRSIRQDFPIRWFDFPPSPDVMDWQPRILPHTHNELLQILTDLGLPGGIVFVMWHVVIVWMARICWLSGKRETQIVVAAGCAGLLAHGIYSLADAIPLWDRLSFVFWLMLAFVTVQFVAFRNIGQPHEV